MLMPFKRVRRYLQAAIRGWVIGRHGLSGKTTHRAFKCVCPKPIRPSGIWTGRGSVDVSGRKQAWLELVGQTVRLAAAGETVAERAPFPPPPHAVVAGATPKFF